MKTTGTNPRDFVARSLRRVEHSRPPHDRSPGRKRKKSREKNCGKKRESVGTANNYTAPAVLMHHPPPPPPSPLPPASPLPEKYTNKKYIYVSNIILRTKTKNHNKRRTSTPSRNTPSRLRKTLLTPANVSHILRSLGHAKKQQHQSSLSLSLSPHAACFFSNIVNVVERIHGTRTICVFARTSTARALWRCKPQIQPIHPHRSRGGRHAPVERERSTDR